MEWNPIARNVHIMLGRSSDRWISADCVDMVASVNAVERQPVSCVLESHISTIVLFTLLAKERRPMLVGCDVSFTAVQELGLSVEAFRSLPLASHVLGLISNATCNIHSVQKQHHRRHASRKSTQASARGRDDVMTNLLESMTSRLTTAYLASQHVETERSPGQFLYLHVHQEATD